MGLTRSNPFTMAEETVTTGGGFLYQNPYQNSMAVLTFVGLVSNSSNQGDAIYLTRQSAGGNPVIFHSGIVGAGTGDRFPLTCEIAVNYQGILGWTGAVGSWGLVMTGYYTPFYLGS